jgi:hypothetical protein
MLSSNIGRKTRFIASLCHGIDKKQFQNKTRIEKQFEIRVFDWINNLNNIIKKYNNNKQINLKNDIKRLKETNMSQPEL